MKIGLSSCGKALTKELFEEYKNSGIDAMELSVGNKAQCDAFDIMSVVPLAKEYGIELWSYHLPFGPFEEIDISNPDIADFTVEYYKGLMAKGVEAGIRIFVIHPSGEPIDEGDRSARMARAKKSLLTLGEYGDSIGAVVAVEDLPRTCLGNSSDEILELISVHESLRVCFDTNHLLGEDNLSFVEKVGNRIITTHVSDYDFVDEKHWLPGEGGIDWHSLYTALKGKGYDGPWLYELGFGIPKTMSRPRKLNCADFARNANEIFDGEKITVIKKDIGTIVFSIDDGCSDTARLASELKKRNLTATFNIVTSWVDGSVETKSPHVTVDELKAIYANGFEIAGHGDTHQNDNVDVMRGNDKLMEWCGMSEIGFASPGSGMTAEYIRESGAKYTDMDITYIRTGSYASRDPRIAELTEKAKADGRSGYVVSQIPFTEYEYDSFAVPSVVVVHETLLQCIKDLATFTADEGICTVFMFHAVRKEGEKNWESTWSYDFDKFCEFADHVCELRDSGRVEVLTNMDAFKKRRI
ncbi:MAG: hypothetical protein E7613_10285 [Ruminococcaceae bacterium]|nr:hypothetical protein [Oscillospiraceae bacterium]